MRLCENKLQPVASDCDRHPNPFSAHQSFPKRNPLETEPFNHSTLHGCRMQGWDTSLAGQIWERLDISEEPLYAQNRSCFCRLHNPLCILMPRPCAFTTAVQSIVPGSSSQGKTTFNSSYQFFACTLDLGEFGYVQDMYLLPCVSCRPYK